MSDSDKGGLIESIDDYIKFVAETGDQLEGFVHTESLIKRVEQYRKDNNIVLKDKDEK